MDGTVCTASSFTLEFYSPATLGKWKEAGCYMVKACSITATDSVEMGWKWDLHLRAIFAENNSVVGLVNGAMCRYAQNFNLKYSSIGLTYKHSQHKGVVKKVVMHDNECFGIILIKVFKVLQHT